MWKDPREEDSIEQTHPSEQVVSYELGRSGSKKISRGGDDVHGERERKERSVFTMLGESLTGLLIT